MSRGVVVDRVEKGERRRREEEVGECDSGFKVEVVVVVEWLR